jgi:putative aldouronate transport system substrate-binding protein
MKKNVFVTVSIALALGITGCSSKPASQEEQASPPPANVNETGLPIVKEKITLKGFARKDPQLGEYSQMLLWKELEDKTNIHIEWDTPSLQNSAERVNLVLASGELPDFFIKGVVKDSDITKYGSTGLFIPLEGLIEKYAPNLRELLKKKPEIKAAITSPDGHIYSLPRIVDYELLGVPRFPMLNLKWLEKVGGKAPTNSDELYTLLKTFKEKDPNGNGQNDEIPYTAHTIDWAMRGLEGMYGLQRNLDYKLNVDENNKVHIWYTDEKYKMLLQYANKLYKDGLIDKDIFTQTDQVYFAKLAEGRVGFTPLLQAQNAGKFAGDYKGITPIKGPHGDQLWNLKQDVNANSGKAIITKTNKNPEATIRMFDYFYGDEGATLLYLGKEGVTYEKRADGTLGYKEEILKNPKGLTVALGAMTIWQGGGEFGYYTDKHLSPMMEGSTRPADYKTVQPYLPKKQYALPLLSKEKQDQMNAVRTDLDTYTDEMRAKFISGDKSFDEWDAYVSTVKKMGLDKLEQIFQESLDDLLKKAK